MAQKLDARNLCLKRVYAPADKSDGARILVDRLWPRGISKEHAALDSWLKEIAPSTELRQWFNHDPARWAEFQQRYRAELAQNGALLDQLRDRLGQGKVTLIYAAHDEAHNAALVLRDLLLEGC